MNGSFRSIGSLLIVLCLVMAHCLGVINVGLADDKPLPGQSLYVCPEQIGFIELKGAVSPSSGAPSVSSSDSSVVTGEASRDGVTIVAGANDTDKVKTADLTIDVPDIPDGKKGSRYVVKIFLKPQKQCKPPSIIDDLKATKTNTKVATQIGDCYMGKTIKLCIGETITDKINTVGGEGFLSASKTKNTNPGVATDSLGSAQASPLSLQNITTLTLKGLSAGTTTVTVSSKTLDEKGWLPYSTVGVYYVTVRACDDKKNSSTQAVPPSGGTLVTPGGTNTPGNSGGNDTKPTTGGVKGVKNDPGDDKKPTPLSPKAPTKDIPKDHSMAPLIPKADSSVGYGLTTSIFHTPYGELVVHLPESMQPGETISGTVIMQPHDTVPNDPAEQAFSSYVVTVENTQVIVDEPVKTFTFQVPTDSVDKETTVVLEDKKQHVLSQAMVVLGLGLLDDRSVSMMLPTHHEIGKPFAVQGPFDGNAANTDIQVNGKPIRKLAESPREIIAITPNDAPGAQSLTVQEGSIREQGTMVSTLPSSTPQATSPSTSSAMCLEEVNRYKAQVQSIVSSTWKAPKPPAKGTWTAELSYNLGPTGILQHVQVLQPSGYPALDSAAMAHVYQTQGHFPPLPQCFDDTTMTIQHTFKVIYR